MKRALKFPSSPAQHAQRVGNSLDQLGDLLTTAQAAAALCYTGPRAIKNFYAYADRQRIPRLHRGSRVLWQASTLAAFLKGDKWTQRRRHASQSDAVPELPKAEEVSR